MLCEEEEIRENSIREYRTLKQKIVNELSEETDMGLGPCESPYLMLLTPESTDKRTQV